MQTERLATLEPVVQEPCARLRLIVQGGVQGVGFRPFVYRLAKELGLAGWVKNSAQGVFIEVEGIRSVLERFLLRIEREKPPRAFIQHLESVWLDAVGYPGFKIRASEAAGDKTAVILPDIATCAECVQELFDPLNRRWRYPFTNCTNCGPRFSIIEALPYDRCNTIMRRFVMCDRCQAEYDNPLDRRFHAQPNACPACGPHMELWDPNGIALAAQEQTLQQAAMAIRQGVIVAVKGLGGFHLVVDARDEDAVTRLRHRKHREEKPFALLYPSLALVKTHCDVSALEERLLRSPESPIVLLRRKPQAEVARSVAPGNPSLGVMLPSTPLHHLLMRELDFPVVATSGNLSDEPICTDEQTALKRLAGIAELFLVHNRPIARPVDDSVVRVVVDRELVLRRARGYAPLPIHLREPMSALLAVGGHLKNTIAVSSDRAIVISQHIGDLETTQADETFRQTIDDVTRLYELHPRAVACDAHPDYRSTQWARESGVPVVAVQHHYAHVLSCMAENELQPPVLGVAWDGTGYGVDGTVWGGEFLLITHDTFQRVASFRTFRLPGGARAIKEPRRAALGLLYECFGDAVFRQTDLASVQAFAPEERALLRAMLTRGINAPLTSSVGRLFDAVASLVGLRQQNRFEGQAAMELEYALDGIETSDAYDMRIAECETPDGGSLLVIDWASMVQEMVEDLSDGISPAKFSVKFHNSLVEAIIAVAKRIGEEQVALSGGCFQNRYLIERAVRRLREEDVRPYWHQRVPPNDGGIALGQIVAASRATGWAR